MKLFKYIFSMGVCLLVVTSFAETEINQTKSKPEKKRQRAEWLREVSFYSVVPTQEKRKNDDGLIHLNNEYSLVFRSAPGESSGVATNSKIANPLILEKLFSEMKKYPLAAPEKGRKVLKWKPNTASISSLYELTIDDISIVPNISATPIYENDFEYSGVEEVRFSGFLSIKYAQKLLNFFDSNKAPIDQGTLNVAFEILAFFKGEPYSSEASPFDSKIISFTYQDSTKLESFGRSIHIKDRELTKDSFAYYFTEWGLRNFISDPEGLKKLLDTAPVSTLLRQD